jgi:hypothetical protein
MTIASIFPSSKTSEQQNLTSPEVGDSTRKTIIDPRLPPACQKKCTPVVFAADARVFRRAGNNFIPLVHACFGAPAISLGPVRGRV